MCDNGLSWVYFRQSTYQAAHEVSRVIMVYCGYVSERTFSALICLQCFDAVGWAAGRASGL